MFAPITKVNEGESNTPCPCTLEVTYSSVEKLSKALGTDIDDDRNQFSMLYPTYPSN
jgi:hypothetical protein